MKNSKYILLAEAKVLTILPMVSSFTTLLTFAKFIIVFTKGLPVEEHFSFGYIIATFNPKVIYNYFLIYINYIDINYRSTTECF
jgi:hypothetical protein